MVRFFILEIVILIFSWTVSRAQNLVINPDFEEVVPHKFDLRIYVDTFYARHWFESTDGSFDIFRDKKFCNDSLTFNVEPGMNFCVNVKSGKYCLGFVPLSYLGYMEHITGELAKPLEHGKKYKVSFYLKYTGNSTPYIPNGIGYKFSEDSLLFKSKILFVKKPSPFYNYLFATEKIYADFCIDEYVTDSTWRKFESVYVAKGGERFITFGRFAYQNDKKIMKQFAKIRYNPSPEKFFKFINDNKSLVIKNITGKTIIEKSGEYDESYYFLDFVEVVELH